MNAKGMLVTVYRSAEFGDTSNGGISARFARVILIGPGFPELFEPTDDAPALYLEERCGRSIAVPGERPAGVNGPMFGGSFVWSSDARFRRVSESPIPVHDRFEPPQPLGGPVTHVKDSDCRLGDDDCCVDCGVTHGVECRRCGGRGFHAATCPEADEGTEAPGVG